MYQVQGALSTLCALQMNCRQWAGDDLHVTFTSMGPEEQMVSVLLQVTGPAQAVRLVRFWPDQY